MKQKLSIVLMAISGVAVFANKTSYLANGLLTYYHGCKHGC